MLKRNLFFLFAVTLFALASFVLDIFNYNPYESSNGVFINFYLSFFLALGGLLAMAIYYFKINISKDKLIYQTFWPTIRQAALASLSVTLLLILKGMRLFDWWIGGSVVIVIILLELFFQTKKSFVKKANQ